MFIFSNPLRFDSPGDFGAPRTVEEDISAAVRMVVGIRGPMGPIQGEVPWDPDMGCGLDYYRHSRENMETTEIAGVVMDALKRGLPDVRFSQVTATIAGQVLKIIVRHSKTATTEVSIPLV